MQLVFEESQDSAGAFTMESSLKDMDGSALYEPGRGTVSHKHTLLMSPMLHLGLISLHTLCSQHDRGMARHRLC